MIKKILCITLLNLMILPSTSFKLQAETNNESFTGKDYISYWFARSLSDRQMLSLEFVKSASKISPFNKKFKGKDLKKISINLEKCITKKGEDLLEKNSLTTPIFAISTICLLESK